MPAIAPPLSPPFWLSDAAAEASDGFSPAEATPLHRSPVALRVEAAGPASAGAAFFVLRAAGLRAALLGLAAFAGAVELLNTGCAP